MPTGVFAEPWVRHTIDDSSQGADGARLADVDGDGRLDIVTPWEEGGEIRVAFQPPPAAIRRPWPSVRVGRVGSPEDAFACDLDGDGRLDVVSSCEGKQQTMFVHWPPSDPAALLDADAWRTEPIPASAGAQMWMFAQAADLFDTGRLNLIVGSKGRGAAVGLLVPGESPRRLADWRYRRLADAGWVMSLEQHDLAGQGRSGILFSDRYGPRRGVRFLAHPGNAQDAWREHLLGAEAEECMFLDVADLDGDGRKEIVVAVKPHGIVILRPGVDPLRPWTAHRIDFPANRFGTSKSVRAADIDLDGQIDLVVTCEQATGDKSGVLLLKHGGDPFSGDWRASDIGGPQGVKFDLIQLIDFDGDGDLDLLTCEERDNLGVIWYENPAR